MQYAAARPFRGDPAAAFHLAEAALTGIGFRTTDRTSGSLEMVGPGMNSTKQSPLAGASRIHVQNTRGELTVEADLGGVARMSRFVTLFPIILVLSLGVALGVVFGILHGPGLWIGGVAAAVVGNAVVWLVLGPLMARAIRRRTDEALDALLANMVSAGEAGSGAAYAT